MGVQVRQKKLSDGRKSLYLDIYHSGRRAYEFLEIYLTKDRQANKESLMLAESIKAKRVLELQNSDHGFIPAFKKKTNFIDYFEKKAKEKTVLVKRDSRPGFVPVDGTYLSTLKHLKAFSGNSIRFSAVTEEWLEQFKKYLLTKMKQITAHTYFAKVKAVLHEAQKERLILLNPADNVQNFPKPDSIKPFLTTEELTALSKADCPKPDVKRGFLFCCNTGLRLSDMANLKWKQIEGDRVIFTQRKTGVVQYLPLNETAKKLLFQGRNEKVLPMPDNYVFPDLGGKSHVYLFMKEWFDNAGIQKKATFHCSRHTFATSLLTSGADIYTVSKLLGHSNFATTEVYAKVVDKKKEDAVNGLPQMEVGV
jgi:integrase